jgi:hypothetical protein
MPPRRALWAGPGARRTLAAGGAGKVEFVVRPGGYVRFGDEWLLLAVPRAPRGPLTMTVTGLERTPLAAGEEIRVEDGALVVGGERVGLARVAAVEGAGADRVAAAPAVEDAGADRVAAAPAGEGAGADRVAASPPEPAGEDAGVRAALAAALAAAPSPPAAFAAGLAALARGDHAAAVSALAGRGPGLTPAGDDVLAGYAAWRHAAGEPVALASPRCSPLGRAYLRCAQRGELPEPAARLLAAIRAGDVTLARRRTPGLARWGATSGAAILWGFAAA